jgi:methylamine---glutamate N-methyltransferase subunit A
MCGIAGIFLKTPSLEPKLGAMLSEMLTTLSNRGPDSAGFAVYGKGQNNLVKLTLRLPQSPDISGALISAAKTFSPNIPTIHANHAVVSVPSDKLQAMQSFFRE